MRWSCVVACSPKRGIIQPLPAATPEDEHRDNDDGHDEDKAQKRPAAPCVNEPECFVHVLILDSKVPAPRRDARFALIGRISKSKTHQGNLQLLRLHLRRPSHAIPPKLVGQLFGPHPPVFHGLPSNGRGRLPLEPYRTLSHGGDDAAVDAMRGASGRSAGPSTVAVQMSGTRPSEATNSTAKWLRSCSRAEALWLVRVARVGQLGHALDHLEARAAVMVRAFPEAHLGKGQWRPVTQ